MRETNEHTVQNSISHFSHFLLFIGIFCTLVFRDVLSKHFSYLNAVFQKASS